MRLSPILSAYIGRNYLVAFFGALAVICGLVLLFDIIELIRRAAGKTSVTLLLLIEMALLKLPQMIQILLPFAVMIGGMIVFWRLTRSRELVVTRAAGVSVWQFLTPVMGIVFVVGVLNVVAFNPLAARLFARYEVLQDKMMLRLSNPLTFSAGGGLWLRETVRNQQIILHAVHVRQNGFDLNLRNVSLFVIEESRFARRFDASTAVLADGQIDLRNVWVMEPGKPSENLATLRLPTTLTLSKIQDNFASPETISFWDLPGFIRFTESSGFSAHKHRMHFQSLLSSPLLLCAMVMVAAVFSLRPNLRAGGILLRLAGGVGAGFLLYFFSKVVFALGLSNTLPPALAAWSPAVVTLLVGLSTLFHQEDG